MSNLGYYETEVLSVFSADLNAGSLTVCQFVAVSHLNDHTHVNLSVVKRLFHLSIISSQLKAHNNALLKHFSSTVCS